MSYATKSRHKVVLQGKDIGDVLTYTDCESLLPSALTLSSVLSLQKFEVSA